MIQIWAVVITQLFLSMAMDTGMDSSMDPCIDSFMDSCMDSYMDSCMDSDVDCAMDSVVDFVMDLDVALHNNHYLTNFTETESDWKRHTHKILAK